MFNHSGLAGSKIFADLEFLPVFVQFPTYPYHDQQINNPYHETDQIYHQQQWLQETSADNIYPVPSSNTVQ